MRKYQVRFRGGIREKGLRLPRRYPTRHLPEGMLDGDFVHQQCLSRGQEVQDALPNPADSTAEILKCYNKVVTEVANKI